MCCPACASEMVVVEIKNFTRHSATGRCRRSSESGGLNASVALVALAVVLAGCSSADKHSSAPPRPSSLAQSGPPTAEQPSVRAQSPPAKTSVVTNATARVEVFDDLTMFDGKTLKGWAITDFGGHGEVRLGNGKIIIGMGAALSGAHWTNPIPKMDYEVALEAMKVEGSDFFCGLTFPVRDAFCSLICGGWGGGVVGLSSIDGNDASENETTRVMNFDQKRWYRIRLRVSQKKIEAWIDAEKVVDIETTVRHSRLRPGEIELSAPVGIATWQTTAALREINVRRLSTARIYLYEWKKTQLGNSASHCGSTCCRVLDLPPRLSPLEGTAVSRPGTHVPAKIGVCECLDLRREGAESELQESRNVPVACRAG